MSFWEFQRRESLLAQQTAGRCLSSGGKGICWCHNCRFNSRKKVFTDVRFSQNANLDLTQRRGSLNGVLGLVVGLVALVSCYLAAHIGSPLDPESVNVAHQSLVHRREQAADLVKDREPQDASRGFSPLFSNISPAASALPLTKSIASGAEIPANSSKLDATTQYSTTIRKPAGSPQVLTGLTDPHGNAVTVSCSTCHATRKPNTENKTVADMNEFHSSLKIAHGKISCLSCHNSNDYDSLKLADGTKIEFTDVMSLCGQCHGPQMRDYEHNVHGGMNGYWDLTKGPRQKNNCVDCHNPHSPQFPKMQPTFKPRDRFLDSHPHE